MPIEPDLRLDVPSFDAEHALQIDLVEAFGKAIAEGKSREIAHEILERLLDYTRVHFLAEELMMRMEGYPGFEAHLSEHGELLAELQRLKASYGRSDQPLTYNAVDGLRSWLTGHVRTQDRTLATFLTSRKPGSGAA